MKNITVALYSADLAQDILGVSKEALHQLVVDGKLKSFESREGRFITQDSVWDYITTKRAREARSSLSSLKEAIANDRVSILNKENFVQDMLDKARNEDKKANKTTTWDTHKPYPFPRMLGGYINIGSGEEGNTIFNVRVSRQREEAPINDQ